MTKVSLCSVAALVVRCQNRYMNNKYNFQNYEEKLYSFWEKKGFFEGKVNPDKESFSIILPPPNANADLHLGHAMYVYEDVMIRYNKLQGKEVLWLAGADHAGIETQFVYEKHLRKQNKSRFDFDRKTLFSDIWEFVMKNREVMENQLRRLGFALDWSRKKFTMDEDIVKIVYDTFKKLHDDGLVYRANRLVSYCTNCGTSFSDLEVNDIEITGKLYYIDYEVKEGGKITIATTRPETYFGDVAVMVHPDDSRYKDLIGKTVALPFIDREIPIIADEYVDPKFGTGAVKVTPDHDANDFEIGKKHELKSHPIIGFDGKMKDTGFPEIEGLSVIEARKIILSKLEKSGNLVKIVRHEMVLHTCYRCGKTLEPLPKEQWFISVDPLKKEAIKLVKSGKIKVHPARFTKQLIQILEDFIDWNISRQIVWGIRIPAYKCQNGSWFVSVEKPKKCQICGECKFVQDEDTFDTWFSSAQWPFATLKTFEGLSEYFYPTTVMETGYDILRAWVSRMIMMCYYATEKVPFEHIFLHGMVRDKKGQKMSKSKGNVINPLKMIDQYGADALRASLIFGTREGGDVVLSEDKIESMRNFANKIWNIGRFIQMSKETSTFVQKETNIKSDADIAKVIFELKTEFEEVEKQYHINFKSFKLAKAFDLMYEFVWHRFADYYIEELKQPLRSGSMEASIKMEKVFVTSLKMLHPYIPFVTEAVWKSIHGEETSILDN